MNACRVTTKSLIIAVALAAIMVVSTSIAAQAPSGREYLDFTVDPVVPGGVSQELAAKMLNKGWEKTALKSDVFAHVQFRDKNGKFYYVDGWVRAGTEVFGVRGQANGVFADFEMVGGCGNVMIPYR